MQCGVGVGVGVVVVVGVGVWGRQGAEVETDIFQLAMCMQKVLYGQQHVCIKIYTKGCVMGAEGHVFFVGNVGVAKKARHEHKNVHVEYAVCYSFPDP